MKHAANLLPKLQFQFVEFLRQHSLARFEVLLLPSVSNFVEFPAAVILLSARQCSHRRLAHPSLYSLTAAARRRSSSERLRDSFTQRIRTVRWKPRDSSDAHFRARLLHYSSQHIQSRFSILAFRRSCTIRKDSLPRCQATSIGSIMLLRPLNSSVMTRTTNVLVFDCRISSRAA